MKSTKTSKLFTILILAFMCAITCFAFSLKKNTSNVSATSETFEMIDGASVRLVDDGGLRFIVKMDETTKNNIVNNANVKLYFLVAPKVLFDNILDGEYINLSQKLKVEVDETKIYEDENNAGLWFANGCIYNVLEKNYQLVFNAVAVIETEVSEGEYAYKYASMGDTERSLYQVLNSLFLIKDGSFYQDILDTYEYFGNSENIINVKTADEYQSIINAVKAGIDFTDKFVYVSEDVINSETYLNAYTNNDLTYDNYKANEYSEGYQYCVGLDDLDLCRARYDYQNFVAVDEVENEKTTIGIKEFNNYSKITVNASNVNTVGKKIEVDMDKNFADVSIFIKTNFEVCFSDYSILTSLGAQALTRGVAAKDVWVEKTFTKEYLTASKGTILIGFDIYGWNDNHFDVDTEFCISEVVYNELSFRVSHWNDGADDTCNSIDIGGYISLARVNTSTAVETEKSIDSYITASITGPVWSAGMVISIDMDKLNSEGICFYTKATPNAYIGVYTLNGDMIYARGNADWLTIQRYFPYDKSSYNGWDKIVFTKADLATLAPDGLLLIGISPETPRGATIGNTTWYISDIEYLEHQDVSYRMSYWRAGDGAWVQNSPDMALISNFATVNGITTVEEGVTIDKYDTFTVTNPSVWTLGALLNIDLSKVTDNVTLYLKVDPNAWFGYFGVDFLYPPSAYWLTIPGAPYFAGCTNGWNKIVISKTDLAARSGQLYIGVQNRTSGDTQGNLLIPPEGFALDTVFSISGVIYN